MSYDSMLYCSMLYHIVLCYYRQFGGEWAIFVRADMLAETMLADLRAGCTSVLVPAHVLHVLDCGFNSREDSRVIARKCKA